MAIGKTRNLSVIEGGVKGAHDIDRGHYPEGQPKTADKSSFQNVERSRELLARQVGTKDSVPLTRQEVEGILRDLAPVAQGIRTYKSLPDEAQKEIPLQKFAVMHAMLKALRKS